MGIHVEEDKMPQLFGHIKIEVCDDEGNIICVREKHNAIVNTGKNFILNRMASDDVASISYCAIGIGTGGVDSSAQQIETEVHRVATIYTDSAISTLEQKWMAFFNTNVPAGSTYQITEVGLFGGGADAGSNTGTLVGWSQFGAVPKTPGSHSLTVDYRIFVSGI